MKIRHNSPTDIRLEQAHRLSRTGQQPMPHPPVLRPKWLTDVVRELQVLAGQVLSKDPQDAARSLARAASHLPPPVTRAEQLLLQGFVTQCAQRIGVRLLAELPVVGSGGRTGANTADSDRARSNGFTDPDDAKAVLPPPTPLATQAEPLKIGWRGACPYPYMSAGLGELQRALGEGWRELASRMARHICLLRTTLFAQGTMPSAVFWLEEGLVKLGCAGPDGHEMTVRLHGPGWLLGAPAALLDRPYSTTATTLARSTVLRLPAAEFRRLAHTDMAFARHVNELLSRDLEGYVVQLSEIGRLPARQRLELFLADQALVWGVPGSDGSCRLTIPFSHREIADVLAVAPEHLSRLLKHLEERGILRRSKGSFCCDLVSAAAAVFVKCQ